MRYKRNESFRYEFESPMDITFKIIKIDGKQIETNQAEAKMKNISPHGIRILVGLDIQYISRKKIKAEFTVDLNSNPFIIKGTFIWQKKELEGYLYGIEIESNAETQKLIVEELKKYSRGTVYLKNRK